MKTLWNQIKFQKDLYLTGGLVMLGMYVFGTILHDIIMVAGDEMTSVFYMGSMMAMTGLFMMMFFFAGIHMVTVFNYAVAMGQSRKRFVPAYMMATFLTLFVLGVLLKLLHVLEGARLGLMFPGLIREDITGPVTQWKYLLAFVLVGTAISVLLGATIIKFGKAAFWVWWALLMLVCIGGPRLFHYLGEYYPDGEMMKLVMKAIELVTAHAQLVVTVSVIGVTVILLGGSYLLLRKQQVNL